MARARIARKAAKRGGRFATGMAFGFLAGISGASGVGAYAAGYRVRKDYYLKKRKHKR